MKVRRRILAVFTAVSLLLTAMPGAAFGAEVWQEENRTAEENGISVTAAEADSDDYAALERHLMESRRLKESILLHHPLI